MLTLGYIYLKMKRQGNNIEVKRWPMNNQLLKKYEAMGFDKGQMEEIRQGIEKGLDVSCILL